MERPRRLDRKEAPAVLAEALGLGDEATPFPWQLRLLERLLSGEVPRSLDIPTGLGKTATIAIWLVARALGAPVPRRLVYVVDRRAVVDQATVVAEELQKWVTSRPDLRQALGLDDRNLPVSTLRGRLVDNREWLEDPSVPAIIVGTVDMIGSRLLFQGYRSNAKVRPYMAGLLGHDTLFVLDEAHLVPPFERLLERVVLQRADFEGKTESALATLPTPRLLSLSATGRSRGGAAFELDGEDRGHPEVRRRLEAPKRLTIVKMGGKEDLASAVAERAWRLADSQPGRYLLFLSRRSHAEQARDRLRALAGLHGLAEGESPAADIELLVGGRRVYERSEADARLRELQFLAGQTEPLQRPAFLIATSAGEVGVDLDADHMVCDLVPWERMVQRLGRVNRRGRGDAQVVVIDAPPEPKTPPEVIERFNGVRKLLARLPRHAGGAFDASPGALLTMHRLSDEDEALAEAIARASTPDPLCPPLERATLDDWSMTSLPDHAGRAAIAPWLRGWVEDRPQTTVIWRRFLPVTEQGLARDWVRTRFFEAAPPHASEVLELDSSQVADWLLKRAKKVLRQAGRLKGTDEADTESHLRSGSVVAMTRGSRSEALRGWTLKELAESSKRELTNRVLPRAELILDRRIGGLNGGLLDPTADALPPSADADPGFPDTAIPFRVGVTEDHEPQHEEGKDAWRERARFPVSWTVNDEPVRWLVVQKRDRDAQTEDDRSAGRPQELAEHQDWVVQRAAALAERLGLKPEGSQILTTAARLHDEGKRAPRWQAAFRAPDGPPLAKTRGPLNVHLLDGYRHEFGSLLHAQRHPDVQQLPDEHRDLLLHLIASHHGHARPVIRTDGCQAGPPSALDESAREAALRFFRLQERLGPWGLAWWEALLRASDQQASRDNDHGEEPENEQTKGEAA